MPQLGLFACPVDILDSSLVVAALMARTLFSAKSTRVEALTVHFETAGLFTFAARPTLLSSFLGVEERGFFFLDGGLASIFETTKSLRNEKRRLAVKSHIVKVTHKQIVGYLALRQQTYGKMRKLRKGCYISQLVPLVVCRLRLFQSQQVNQRWN